MTGRGIDQVLPKPVDPGLHEYFAQSADDYVRLAEAANGPIRRPVDVRYPWGEALDEWRRMSPQVRIANLETAITRSESFDPKGINYRMSPENVGCLSAAGFDCCTLANNHVLDWGEEGLIDTMRALKTCGIRTCGAGRNLDEARAPAVCVVPRGGRVVVYACAVATSGVPRDWAAGPARPGVNFLPSLSEIAARQIGDDIQQVRRPGDLVVVSVHWGANWGYEITPRQREFAHALIDHARVAIVHGHSSHHPKAMEVHRGGLILYGCGDFLNDYEGIRGYEEFRGDLVLMYFADFRTDTCVLEAIELVALQIKRFRLHAASAQDTDWLRKTLERQSAPFGVRLAPLSANRFRWMGN
jgi:poly-gamma-glutamate capsule biosynthesis protein CapA/YwtB (metallophosphatase superfamily)